MKTKTWFLYFCATALFLFPVAVPNSAHAKLGPPRYDVSVYREIIREYQGKPEAVKAWMSIGIVSSNSIYAQYGAAQEAYTTVAEKYPKSQFADDALWYLAKLYEWNLEDSERAVIAYSQLLSRFGGVRFEENPYTHVKPMPEGLTREDIEEHIVDLNARAAEILKLSKDAEKAGASDSAVHLQLAYAYVQAGALKHAEEVLREFLKKPQIPKESQAEAHFRIGEIYGSKWTERISDPFGKYIFGVSSDPVVSRKTQLLQEALKQYREVFTEYPNTQWAPMALFNAGIAHTQIGIKWVPDKFRSDHINEITGDFENAEEVFRKLITDFPQSELKPDALYELGVVYRKLDQQERAKGAFNEVIKGFPASEAAAKASIQLKQ